jgi:hypothetical protein
MVYYNLNIMCSDLPAAVELCLLGCLVRFIVEYNGLCKVIADSTK